MGNKKNDNNDDVHLSFEERVEKEKAELEKKEPTGISDEASANVDNSDDDSDNSVVDPHNVNEVVAASNSNKPAPDSAPTKNFKTNKAKEGTFNELTENVVQMESHGQEEGRLVAASRCEGVGEIPDFDKKNENYKKGQSGYTSEASNVQDLKTKHEERQRGQDIKTNDGLDRDRFNTVL